MKAITTKYLPATNTNTKGSRIKAFDCDGNQVTIPYPHELSGEDCYRLAAVKLSEKMEWSWGELVGGGIKNGYVFCLKLQERASYDHIEVSLPSLLRTQAG